MFAIGKASGLRRQGEGVIMNDQEAIEIAAMAAGFGDKESQYDHDKDRWWNPLEHDGDALMLAVKLKMSIICDDDSVIINGARFWADNDIAKGDMATMTRWGIVEAAVQIAEKIQKVRK